MSFFSNLSKKIKSLMGSDEPQTNTVDTNQSYVTPQNNVDTMYANDHDWDDDYFAGIINEDTLPGYTVERNVHPRVFDFQAHPKCYPITFLIKKDGRPVLAVMVMRMDQMKAMISRGTYSILEDNGITYIRFFREMLNEESYVLNRVKEYLGSDN